MLTKLKSTKSGAHVFTLEEIGTEENQKLAENMEIEKFAKDQNEILLDIKLKDIILDFSCVNFVDSMGVDAILTVNFT